MAEDPEVLTTTEARSGVGTHVVRYVLIGSMVLAVAALIWVFALAPEASNPVESTPVEAMP